jgi:hypothetical protein
MKHVKLFEQFLNEGWDEDGNSGVFSIGNKKVNWSIRYVFDKDSTFAQINVDTAEFAEAMDLNADELVSDYSEIFPIISAKPENDNKNWKELNAEDFDLTDPIKKYNNPASFLKWAKPFNKSLEADLKYYK